MEDRKLYYIAKLFATYGILGGAIFLSSFFVFTVVTAGDVTPNASPTSTSYTLTDIYNRLTTNQTATSGNHSFTPDEGPSLDGTLFTLTEIYDAIPTIASSTVVSGTTYLGINGSYDTNSLTTATVQLGVEFGVGQTGALTPDGGDASTADIFLSKTAHVTNDWNLDTGTLTLACATDTFDAAGNLVANTYDGDGDGSNRWCMTDSGTATAGNILFNQIAWVDGTAIIGTMPSVGEQTITPSTENQSISAGYHDGSGYCAGDADLVASNIKSGVDLFGVEGTYTPEVNLPACGFAGDSGDVWVKNENCGWDDRCELGTNCEETCLVALVSYAVETNGFSATCNAVATLLADDCNVCVVE